VAPLHQPKPSLPPASRERRAGGDAQRVAMTEETAPLNLPASGSLEHFLKFVSDSISEGFEQLGGVMPLVFVVTENGNGYVVGVPSTTVS
jgi:hypothetical protein